MRILLRTLLIGIFCALLIPLAGCRSGRQQTSQSLLNAGFVAIDLSNPALPTKLPMGVRLSVARNGWTQFVIQVDLSLLPAHPTIALPRFPNGVVLSAFEIRPAPVDMRQANFIRFANDDSVPANQPRALIPLPILNGAVDLSSIKTAHDPILLWIDVFIPTSIAPGDYASSVQLQDETSPIASLPIQLTVQNLTLSADPNLHIAAPLDWTILSRQYPGVFQGTPPRLLSRTNPQQAKLIQLLDSFQQIAHENHADLFLPQIQPIVKWPLGKGPDIDWSDFDSVVAGWFDGTAFPDHRPIQFWPLPTPDSLEQFDLRSKIEFWKLAHEHFSARNWKAIHPVVLTAPPDLAIPSSRLLSNEASEIFQADPNLQAIVPLDDPQIGFSNARLICSIPGPVTTEDKNSGPSAHWLSPAKFPTAAMTQQGIRSLAWQAFADNASIIVCDNPIPPANRPAQADQIAWFYPGESFGLDHPLPTIQLKWLRQAQQDYEYLLIAKQHNVDTLKLCQLVTQPVVLKPDQPSEPMFDLFTGQSDPHVCEQARQILVDELLHGSSDTGTSGNRLSRIRWFANHERQIIVPNSIDWKWNLKDSRIEASLHLTLYNTADQMPQGGHVQWLPGENGWDVSSANCQIASIDRFHLTTANPVAQFDPKMIGTGSSQPMEIQYTDEFTRQTTTCQAALPVAVSQRHPTPLVIDGNLNDWYPADAIVLNRPLVEMLNQRSVKTGTLELSPNPASIYSGWSDDHFYLSFRLGGVIASDLRSTRNFVAYDHGRAWGEDLCEFLIQPIYIDNFVGPLLHVVCKPGGNWVEQLASDMTWQPFEASGVRYASGVDPTETIWRGEVAIPWRAINAKGRGRPALLRFNCIQHQQETSQSASWAGPIDQSRDGKISGLLLIKE